MNIILENAEIYFKKIKLKLKYLFCRHHWNYRYNPNLAEKKKKCLKCGLTIPKPMTDIKMRNQLKKILK